MANSENKDSKFTVVTGSFSARAALYEHLFQFENSISVEKSFASVEGKDVLVLVCNNSYGLASDMVREGLRIVGMSEADIKRHILVNFLGEQPPGTCIVFPLPFIGPTVKDKEKEKKEKAYKGPRFLVWVCAARAPKFLSKDFAYSATWSALCSIHALNREIRADKKKKDKLLKNFVFTELSDADTVTQDREAVVRDVNRQVAFALKTWLGGDLIESDDVDSANRRHGSIIQDASTSRVEMERELEGLLWSRDLESRGLCSQQELDILVNWVTSNGPNSISAANALCALLHRPETEFALSQLTISSRITAPDGCLGKLLDLTVEGKITVHNPIARKELTFGDKIGSGNAGEVYKGTYKGEPVAIKTFGENHVDEKEFRKEMVVLSIVKGPHVVACYGGSTEVEDEFIVMELMECSLYDLIHDETFDMDEEMRLTFALQTANAMQFLHSCGLIHRDLKSLNILISKVFEAKLCDFGLSRVVDRDRAMTSNIGTVSWIAPEVFAKKHYSEKADVYSYGVILWEMLSRKMPFGDVEAFSVPLLVTRGERPAFPKDAAAHWRSLIKKCWDQKPQKRPMFDEIVQRVKRLRLEAPPDKGAKKGPRGMGRFKNLKMSSSASFSASSTSIGESLNGGGSRSSLFSGTSETGTSEWGNSEINYEDGTPPASNSSEHEGTISEESEVDSSPGGGNNPGPISGMRVQKKAVRRIRNEKTGEPPSGDLSASQSLSSSSSSPVMPSVNSGSSLDGSPHSSRKGRKAKDGSNTPKGTPTPKDKTRALSIRNPGISRIVNVPGHFEMVFTKAETSVFKYFSDFIQDTESGTLKTADKEERYLLLQGKALSVNFFSFLQDIFNFRSPNRQHQFAQNLFFDLGRSLGKADRKEAKSKLGSDLQPVEEVSLLPVSLAYRGWASCKILNGSSFSSKADDFALVWQQDFSFEAESWLRHNKAKMAEKEANGNDKHSDDQDDSGTGEGSGSNSSEEEEDSLHTNHCVCTLTCGYYSGWIESALGFPVIAVEVLCKARGDSTCVFVASAAPRLEQVMANFAEENSSSFDALSLKKVEIPRFIIERRVAAEGNAGSWLQQYLDLYRRQQSGRRRPGQKKRLSSSTPKASGIQRPVNLPSNLARIKTGDLQTPTAMEDAATKHFSKLHFKPTFGSIEVDGEHFILMRAESLSSEIYSVMLDLFGTSTVESTDLAHEFAVNFIYDFGRSIGQSDQQLFSSKVYPVKDLMQLKAGVIVNMASTGWGTGALFSAYGDVPAHTTFSSDEHYFMVGLRCWNTFESDTWHHMYATQKAPAPHCLLAAAYVSGWCEANYKVPMIGVEVECDAMRIAAEDDFCDFIVAHPNQVEHFVRYYSEHQRNRRDSNETHLELLAKTRSLRNRTRPGMGNWLKKIIERETSLVNVPPEVATSGQVVGAPKKEGEEANPTSDEDSILKSDSKKSVKSSAARSARKGSSSQVATPTTKKRKEITSSRKSLDVSREGSSAVSADDSKSRSTEKTDKSRDKLSPEDPSKTPTPLSKSERADKKDATPDDKPSLSKSDLSKK